MASVFIFLDNEYINDALECGIKLSEHGDVSIDIFGDKKKCMTGFLNPNDYDNSSNRSCMLCDIADKYCHVYEAALLEGGMTVDDEVFKNTIIPYDRYSLGMYRKPRVAIHSTILPDAIRLQKRKYDIPMLYTNSEQLYVDMKFEQLCDSYENYKELMIGMMYQKFGKEIGYSLNKLSDGMLLFEADDSNMNIIVSDEMDKVSKSFEEKEK